MHTIRMRACLVQRPPIEAADAHQPIERARPYAFISGHQQTTERVAGSSQLLCDSSIAITSGEATGMTTWRRVACMTEWSFRQID